MSPMYGREWRSPRTPDWRGFHGLQRAGGGGDAQIPSSPGALGGRLREPLHGRPGRAIRGGLHALTGLGAIFSRLSRMARNEARKPKFQPACLGSLSSLRMCPVPGWERGRETAEERRGILR
jgi:hypothetical protein